MGTSSSFYNTSNPTPSELATAQDLLDDANAASAAALADAAAAHASQVAAASSASAASASQTAAATSATNAASSASAASTSASSASTSASTATTQASGASTSASNAASSAAAASTSASGASTSATNAATSATNAHNSELAAATSESNAAATLAAAALKASNLSDLTNAGTARTNLGLAAVAASGSASDLSTGTLPAARLGLVGDIKPGGRLTFTSGTPVLSSSVTGGTTVYYTPYLGDLVPIWDGSHFIPTVFTELSQATTDTTKSPAAVAANGLYDVFVWSDSGTLRATRGPGWSSTTSRGTGAGTTELQRVNGILVNKNAITNGPAAGYGTYVGSFYANSSGTIDWSNLGAASGGQLVQMSVWNMYNRVLAIGFCNDSGAQYTYTTATIRAARASNNNRINFITGLAEDTIWVGSRSRIDLIAAVGGYVTVGVGLDSISTLSYSGLLQTPTANALAGLTSTGGLLLPQIGAHYLQALEAGDGANANALNLGGAQLITMSLPM